MDSPALDKGEQVAAPSVAGRYGASAPLSPPLLATRAGSNAGCVPTNRNWRVQRDHVSIYNARLPPAESEAYHVPLVASPFIRPKNNPVLRRGWAVRRCRKL